MKLLPFWLISLVLSFSLGFARPSESAQKVIGYYTHRSDTSGMKVEEIPAKLLTHVIYSFVVVSDDGKCQIAREDAINAQGKPAVLSRFQILKRKYPKLALMMAIGGWGGSGKFSEIAATDEGRKTFAKSCLEILEKYSLDGIDLDWEYPVTGGVPTDSKSPNDTKNFVFLLEEFRKSLDRVSGPRKILSAAVAAYREGPVHLDVPGMTRYVDWLGIMAYDYRGAGSPTTGHHAALFVSKVAPDANPTSNADFAIQSYLSHGAPPEKLILGVPFYAHSWAKVSPAAHGLYQPFNGVPATRLGDGALSYAEVLSDFMPQSVSHFDSDAKAPWLYDAKNQTLVSYEDPDSLKFKIKYILKNKLGGVMIWELNHDGKKNELLKSLSDGLLGL